MYGEEDLDFSWTFVRNGSNKIEPIGQSQNYLKTNLTVSDSGNYTCMGNAGTNVAVDLVTVEVQPIEGTITGLQSKQTDEEEGNYLWIILIVLAVVIALLAIGGAAYYIKRKKMEKQQD